MIFMMNASHLSAEIVDIYLKNGDIFKNSEIIKAVDNFLYARDKYSSPKIPYKDIKIIIFQGGSVSKGGIVLINGAISGKLISYEKRVWKFKLPSGVLIIDQPNQLMSINFINTVADNQSLPENVRVTSIIEWMETRHLIEPDIISDANVKIKLIKTLFTNNKLLVTFQTQSIKHNDKTCDISSYWIDDKNRRSQTIRSRTLFPIRGGVKKLTYDPVLKDASSIAFNFTYCDCSYRCVCTPCGWFSTPPLDINWLKSKQ